MKIPNTIANKEVLKQGLLISIISLILLIISVWFLVYLNESIEITPEITILQTGLTLGSFVFLVFTILFLLIGSSQIIASFSKKPRPDMYLNGKVLIKMIAYCSVFECFFTLPFLISKNEFQLALIISIEIIIFFIYCLISCFRNIFEK